MTLITVNNLYLFTTPVSSTCYQRCGLPYTFNCQFDSTYPIYSIKRPGRLLNFWTLRVGAYSRWALPFDRKVQLNYSLFVTESVLFIKCVVEVNIIGLLVKTIKL